MQTIERMKGSRGFTLIELMIVVAIIGILSVVAMPTFKKQDEKRVRTFLDVGLRVAQMQFHDQDKDGDGVADFATTLAELGAAAFISDSIADGKAFGYRFKMNSFAVSDSQLSWNCSASPLLPKVSGELYYFVDETHVLRASTSGPAGPNSPPYSGGGGGASSARASTRLDPFAKQAVSTLRRLNKLGDGQVLAGARGFLSPPDVATILDLVDADADTNLRVMEILGADLLARARAFLALQRIDPGAAIGDDKRLTPILAAYLRKGEKYLVFDDDCETAGLGEPLSEMTGDPLALLDAATQ